MALPTPLQLMKRSKRILDFEDDGKPLHPLHNEFDLKDDGKGSLPQFGANFTVSSLLLCNKHVLLERKGDVWSLPSSDAKKNVVKTAILSLSRNFVGKSKRNIKTILNGREHKVLYSNIDHFDERTTKHAWVETEIQKWEVETSHFDSLQSTTANAKWFSTPPNNIHMLHKIIISMHLR